MAFPTTSILDNFNRADAANIAGSLSWVNDLFGLGGWHIVSSQASNPDTDYRANLWDVSYTESEVYVTITGGLSGSNEIAIGLRYNVADKDGYFLYYQHNGGSPTLGLYKHNNGVSTQIGSNFSFSALSNGDKLGLSVSGTTLEAWIYQSGSWSSLGTQTDSDYASGKLWMYSRSPSATVTLDDFGGGEIVSTSNIPIIFHHLQEQGIS